MRVLLTGATGFIGKRLARRLVAAGHQVRSAGRRRPSGCPEVSHVQADFRRDHSPDQWLPRLHAVDAVINAVGIIRERAPGDFEALHAKAPIALFAACKQAGVRRIVQISALGADDRATSRFHRSKKRADDFLLGLGISCVVAQPSLVYGPGGGSARLFDLLASLPLTPLPAGGRQLVQPIHVDDAIDALLALVESPEPTGRIPLTGPQAIELRELLAQLRSSMGLGPLRALPIPAPLVELAASVSDRVPGALMDTETWQMLERGNTASSDATAALLGRPPRSVSQFIAAEHAGPAGLQALMRWLIPILRLSVAAVWIVTGIVSLGVYPVEDSLALLARTGLFGTPALVALYGAALLDLALGVAVLCSHSRWLWHAQIALILGYTAIISWKLPEFWLHPYGPVLKNLPLLAVLWLLLGIRPPVTRRLNCRGRKCSWTT